MNSMDIQEALSEIDDRMVEDAAPAGKGRILLYKFKTVYLTKKRFRALSTAAVLLVLILLVNLVSGGIRGMSMKTYEVAAAEYPEIPSSMGNSTAYQDYIRQRAGARGAVISLEKFFSDMNEQFLGGRDGENRLYSPFAVYMELAALAELSGGETRQEILDVLGAESIEAVREQASDMFFANYSDSSRGTIIPAMSMWMNEDVKYNEDTLKTLADSYYASSFSGRMGSTAYNKSMKAWIDDATGGLLKDSTDNLQMSPEDVLHLVSTLYFQGRWADRFKSSENTDDVFYSPRGEITATYMHETMGHGMIFVGDHFMATGKGLEDGSVMWFILPDEGIKPEELLSDQEFKDFNFYMMARYNLRYAEEKGQDLPEWEKSKYIKIHLSLPKFDITESGSLTDGLRALGISSCFDMKNADFTPLTSDTDVFVSTAVQGARLITDEEGVKAAVYVDIGLAGAAMPPEDEMDLVIDRPFITILTSSDGVPLYAGIVNEP